MRDVRRSVGWNYLTRSVPAVRAALQVLDLENSWFIGKFPSTANWAFFTARANCFTDPTPCKNNNNQGIMQRPSCAICSSADGTGTLCSSNIPYSCAPSRLALLLPMCPPPPPPPCTASALMNIKMALGVTTTDWAPTSSCMPLGSSGGGSFNGVQCNALGNPVRISLKSNLFRARLDKFASRILSLPNLAVL
ncbi:unnamed protein product [Closterium sp. Naga37s-1]|nr:unnamed protein product [Closterium sp. Naga37s-1]CAI5520280.1 unnamed protein product [Closterium sp. Naga37s-1]